MTRIVTHLERLLFMHDCVIIPGFGGFVLQTVPATCNVKEHEFLPSRKEIVFNPTLKHNDGLLAESYMQELQLDFKEAQALVDQDTEALKLVVNQRNRVTLGKIGYFSQGEEGELLFHPAEDALFSVDSYGLAPFHVLPLRTILEAREKDTPAVALPGHRKNRWLIPVNRKVAAVTGAVAAAIVLFFIISVPVEQVNTSLYRASLIPSDIVSSSAFSAPEGVLPGTSPEEAAEEIKNTPEEQPENPAAIPPDAPSAFEKTVKPVTADPVVSNQKLYYIVIGSFVNEGQANEYISQTKLPSDFKTGIVSKGDKVRVYADKFTSREVAEAYLSTLRQERNFENAWLFISR